MEEKLKELEQRVAALEMLLKREVVEPVIAEPVVEPVIAEPVVEPVVAEPVVEPVVAELGEFAELKKMLNSTDWPAAIDPTLICNTTSDQDKEDRAEGILDLIIDVHLEGLSILDFGCGEGHLSWKSLMQKPKVSVGYDIQEYNWQRWPVGETLFMHTDWESVKKKGPYNVIVAYDVLDHIEGNDVTEILENLKKIRQVMAPNASVYVRCHPFVSRHGTHLYHQLNKAYAHLVFTPEELVELGYSPGPHTRRIIHPVGSYRQWFQMANFKIRREQIVREPIEPYFTKGGLVTDRIKDNWKVSPKVELSSGRQFPTVQIEQQFVDFILI